MISRLTSWLPSACCAFGATVALAALVVSSQPRAGQVAVMFSPLLKADQSLELAAGAEAIILRAGGWRNVVIVSDPDDDIRRRLRDAGAWMLIEAGSALGCFIDSPAALNPSVSEATR